MGQPHFVSGYDRRKSITARLFALRAGILLLACLGLVSCAPAFPAAGAAPWQYADLRLLDPADVDLPSDDLLALYVRRAGDELQFRADFLDIETGNSDLFILLDTGPGGSTSLPSGDAVDVAWDVLLAARSTGELYAQDSNNQPLPNLRLRLLCDPVFDTVTLSLNAAALPAAATPFQFQAFTMQDRTLPVSSAGSPPPRVPLALAFWNTFPAVTPAQALRSWDGAHSGPQRLRHGLRNLLEAAAATDSPLFLLDLKTPTALSALDFVGGVERLRELSQRGLVVLPDVDSPVGFTLPPPVSEVFLAESRHAGELFALPAPLPFDTSVLYPATLPDSGGGLIVDGITLEARRALANPVEPLVVFGGDFTRSNWGEPQAARRALEYLSAHPWVWVLDAGTLTQQAGKFSGLQEPRQPVSSPAMTLYTAQGAEIPSGLDSADMAAVLQKALASSQPSPITGEAWRMFFARLPSGEARLDELGAQSLGLAGHLLAAAQWAENPAAAADCSRDVDWDGQAECVLASENFFGVFEMDGAVLTVAVYQDEGEVHQLIAPASQFAFGLSDPLEWDVRRGIFADPVALPGAFVDAGNPTRPFTARAATGKVVFTALDGSGEKIFTLLEGGLRVEYSGGQPVTTRIPLALDPWLRFGVGWKASYSGDFGEGAGGVWQAAGGAAVEILLGGENAALSSHRFTDSLAVFAIPEDPNRNYPPGHFLPFPLAVVEVSATKGLVVELWFGEGR